MNINADKLYCYADIPRSISYKLTNENVTLIKGKSATLNIDEKRRCDVLASKIVLVTEFIESEKCILLSKAKFM